MKSKSKFFIGVGSRNKDQQGFTLIELIIGVVVLSLVVGGITMTFLQIFNNTARSNNHNTAVRQVQNAGMWLSRDIQTAENITADGTGNGFPLILTWYTDWRPLNLHRVEYNVVDDNLTRTYSDNSTSENTTVARYIDPVQTSCTVSGYAGTGHYVTFNMTATVGTGLQVANETRLYEIEQRPKSVY